jgi:TolA-binding protein
MVRVTMPICSALVGLALANPAQARPEDVSMPLVEQRVTETLHDAEDLEAAAQPGRGVMSPRAATTRFEDSLYRFMVKDYAQAAEGFFILVTTGALVQADLQLDAEWYLADSLYEMGNTVTAEAWFKQISSDEDNPFHDDAVRRLLELYAETDRTEEFKAYYDAQIARGKVAASDTITYSLAKAFYHQKDLARAKSALLEIGTDSPIYRKARYWLGTIAVVEGNLDEALPYFDAVAAMSVDGPEDREILDLSLLASARICLEQHKYDEAAARYGKIGGDSKYLADKLYEETWTFITHKEDIRRKLSDETVKLTDEERADLVTQERELREAAQRGVDIFLLAFPEHPYTPQLKLLAGHLQQHAKDWDGALETYERVIAEYRPVRERFELLSSDSAAASRYVEPILDFERTGYGETDLPPYALAMLVQDPELRDAAEMKVTLEKQREDVATSEQLIEQINTAFSRPEGLELHKRRIAEVDSVSDNTLLLELDLLQTEEDLMLGEVRKGDLDALSKRRSKLTERVFSGEGGAAVETELSALCKDHKDLRPTAATDQAALGPSFKQLDDWHAKLAGHRPQLAAVTKELVDSEAAELEKIKSRFTFESGEVESQRVDLTNTGEQADEVMTGLTRQGFGRLATVFGEAAMTADMGIVDVYWATLLESTGHRTDLSDERKKRLDALDSDFSRIRETLGSPPK